MRNTVSSSLTILQAAIFAVCCWWFPLATQAFHVATNNCHVVQRSSLQLNAWSLPDPSSMAATFSGSTWYNEYNPTHRRTVYDEYVIMFILWERKGLLKRASCTDLFFCCFSYFFSDRVNPYSFVALGDDWPLSVEKVDSNDVEMSSAKRQGQQRRPRLINPLRLIANRLRRNSQHHYWRYFIHTWDSLMFSSFPFSFSVV